MDGVNGVGAPSAPSDNQQTGSGSGQDGLSAQEQADFNKAVEEFAGAILLGDHFVLQGIIDETLKDSTSS